ncbi:unnamed protein product [Euphydryas editha]|uniref:Uncharacterized protein n=1 Tax=Euphydryas editha TaxID=104508 RepID=A0AAU9U9H7_EUPED|nr:unnamed protein product [Euphydryas editha]
MNEFIWRIYLILTKNETNTGLYLDTLHQKFIAAFPEMGVSRQRIGTPPLYHRNATVHEQKHQHLKH